MNRGKLVAVRAAGCIIVMAACGRLGFDGPDIGDAAGKPSDHSDAYAGSTDDAAANAADVNITSFQPCPSSVTLIGNASCSGDVLLVTPDAFQNAGAAWISTPFLFTGTTSFSMQLTMAFVTTGAGGDGAAIVIQSDPRGSAAIGSRGDGLGYETITPSLALELDVLANYGDLPGEHIGIDFDGVVDTTFASPSPFELTSPNPFTVWLDYDGPTNLMSGYIAAGRDAVKPGSAIMTATNDLSRLGSHVWIGVTASTGAAKEEHRVLDWRTTVTP